jgi:hypothetical protein
LAQAVAILLFMFALTVPCLVCAFTDTVYTAMIVSLIVEFIDLNLLYILYLLCRKLVDTPFPFPWAQAVAILLFMFALTAPCLVCAFTDTVYTAMIVSFMTVHTYHMLNEVARDLEDPFDYHPNELPLSHLQFRLNERLLAVSRTERPRAFTDLGSLQVRSIQ